MKLKFVAYLVIIGINDYISLQGVKYNYKCTVSNDKYLKRPCVRSFSPKQWKKTAKKFEVIYKTRIKGTYHAYCNLCAPGEPGSSI